jgi:hypothetical protein
MQVQIIFDKLFIIFGVLAQYLLKYQNIKISKY